MSQCLLIGQYNKKKVYLIKFIYLTFLKLKRRAFKKEMHLLYFLLAQSKMVKCYIID